VTECKLKAVEPDQPATRQFASGSRLHATCPVRPFDSPRCTNTGADFAPAVVVREVIARLRSGTFQRASVARLI